jgi:histidine kinase
MRGTAEAMPVRASAARLERAVLELLANARDAVLERRRTEPEAPARIEVGLWREEDAVMIEVRDTGTGIVEQARESLFDPFFTTKDPGRGIGLGLAFAAGVARGMGGGIEAWNLPEGGACFRRRIATVDVAAAEAPRPGYAAA